MSETLIGVVIGGLIASITSIAQLIYNHFHWKRETNFTYLKEHRLRLERKNDEILEMVSRALSEDIISNKLASELLVHMPKSAAKLFDDYLAKKDRSIEAQRVLFFNMTIELSMALEEID
jgi:hypothetical protein